MAIAMGPRLALAVHELRPIIARLGDRATVDNCQAALKENGFKFGRGTVQRAIERLRAEGLAAFALELSDEARLAVNAAIITAGLAKDDGDLDGRFELALVRLEACTDELTALMRRLSLQTKLENAADIAAIAAAASNLLRSVTYARAVEKGFDITPPAPSRKLPRMRRRK